MRVLYVNHTAVLSGAERSLLSLLGALPEGVRARAATPPGALQEAIGELHIPTSPITGTAGSLRFHPLHTPRAAGEMALAAMQLRRIARLHDVQLAHANSIRAGVMLGLARPRGVARVVHVRDCLPPGALTTATMKLIATTATIVIANSRYTADSVRAAAPEVPLRVVHNAVDLERWNPARLDRSAAREALGQAGRCELLLGVVAQLTPWKGQDTAIEALRLLREDGIDAHLLLIGSAKFIAGATRYDNQAFLLRLRTLVADAGLQDSVWFLGEREDVPELVRAMDVLLLPSREEPFGRAVIEAMALEVPVIATQVGGPAEILEQQRGGLLAPPGEPLAWAEALGELARNPAMRVELGRAGRERVEEAFTLSHQRAATLEAYEQALAASARRG